MTGYLTYKKAPGGPRGPTILTPRCEGKTQKKCVKLLRAYIPLGT